MIPHTWSDDIPENIFGEGKVTLLEKLSAPEMKAIRASSSTRLQEIRSGRSSCRERRLGTVLQMCPTTSGHRRTLVSRKAT